MVFVGYLLSTGAFVLHSPVFVDLLVSPVTLLLLVSVQEFLPLLVFFFSWLGGFEKS
jgi:hypothetical protein